MMPFKKQLLLVYEKLACLSSSLYDFFTRRGIVISIGDIMSKRGSMDGIQMVVASRLLDVEAYRNNGDESFKYQNLLSDKNEQYDLSVGNRKFKDTIESYLTKGYDGMSRFLLDNDFLLRNGTHRTAMHLHLKIYTAKAFVMNRKYFGFDILYDKYRQNLPSHIFQAIISKLNMIQEQLIADGVSFNAVIPQDMSLFDCVSLYKEDIHVKKEICINPPSDYNYCHGDVVLSFDGISRYKLVLFTLDNPQYEIVSGKLESQKMQVLNVQERFFFSRSCYEGKQVFDSLTPYFE